MGLRTIIDIMMDYPVNTIVGIGFALLFLPMHAINPDEHWAIIRMAWWVGFLIYINVVYEEYKEEKTPLVLKSVWRPSTSAWVNRWGVSWRTLIIVIPTMLVTFFFIMLVMFA